MKSIAEPLKSVRQEIEKAAAAAGHPVKLLAVSKAHPVALLEAAYKAGQRDFGENYVQEALQKIADLRTHEDIIWHYIGPLQSNKTRDVAEAFHWVHTVDRLKIARRLSEQRPPHLSPLQVCIQVNISGESQKAGVTLPECVALAQEISQLPNLSLRGLMCIPRAGASEDELRQAFREMRLLQSRLQKDHPQLDTLSMGMSGDYLIAIEEGATIVRVGSRIFGARAPRKEPKE